MKSPDERGHPAAAWIVEARERLGLSDRQVIALLGKWSDSTLRKAEADSRNLSRPMWRALVDLYAGLARERGIALPAVPKFREAAAPDAAAADQFDVAAAIREQTEVMRDHLAAITRLAEAVEAAVRLPRADPSLGLSAELVLGAAEAGDALARRTVEAVEALPVEAAGSGRPGRSDTDTPSRLPHEQQSR